MPESSRGVLTLRPARREDAPHIARLLNVAGHGLPLWYWTQAAAEGEKPFDLGTRRAAQDEGDFSWHNSTMAEWDGAIAGGLITYRIATAPVPLEELPPPFRPLQALENRVLGSDYVLALAVYPVFRRHGIASRLLEEAEARAVAAAAARSPGTSAPGLSLVCADSNTEALALYAAHGFRVEATEPVVPAEGWFSDCQNWLLLVKPVP